MTASGATVTGFVAYRELAKVVPIGWPVLPMLYLPGARPVGRRLYRAVADHRGCGIEPFPRGATMAAQAGGVERGDQ